jgi:hypothetical protein
MKWTYMRRMIHRRYHKRRWSSRHYRYNCFGRCRWYRMFARLGTG